MASKTRFRFEEDMIVSVIDPSISYCALNRKQSHLVTSGFARLLGMNVPDEIICLFFLYYFESMPSSYISGLGQINYEKSQIYRKENVIKDKSYWVSQVGWKTGRHSFKVRVDTLPDGSISVGVVTNPKGFVEIDTSKVTSNDFSGDWAFDSERSGLTYQLFYFNDRNTVHWSGNKWHFDGLFHYDHGIKIFNKQQRIDWKDGDVVEFIIDCDEWKLQINFNDQQIETLDVDKYQKYFPAIAFFGRPGDVQLQVLSCE